jgi:hypothetical protein
MFPPRHERGVPHGLSLQSVRYFLQSEDGFLGAILGGLAGKIFGGSLMAKGIGTAVGGFLGNRIAAGEDRRNARLDYEQQRELGFTHSEIAGAGGAGAGDTTQAIMGNQHNQFVAQQREQEFQHTQRELDRVVAMRAQDMGLASAQTSANATLGAASMARDAAYNQAGTQFDIAAMNNDRQWQQMANDWANNNPELNLKLKQMTMGVENMQVEMIMRRNGLDVSGGTQYSQQEFNRRMRAVMEEMAAIAGNVRGEGARQILGTVNDAREAGENFFMGNGPQVNPNPANRTPPMPAFPYN